MKKVTPASVVTTQQKVTRVIAKVLPFTVMGLMIASVLTPAFAVTDYSDKVQALINNIINIICFVVIGIGAFLAIWGLIAMIMAAKQDDTNAQTQASQKLMVGIALIAVPIAIQALKIDELIMSYFNEIKSGSTTP